MRESNTYTYLDWAATAPLCAEARLAMQDYLFVEEEGLSKGANPNSLHSCGRSSFGALEQARLSLSRSLGIRRADELVFTSCATESNNTALYGMVAALKKKATQSGNASFVPHIITSEIEHDSVLAALRMLESLGCELSLIKPDSRGFIEAPELESAFRKNTVLVSIQYANNEIGSVQAIEQLAKLTHDKGAFFHTDAVQALGKIPFCIDELGVDAASFSAHKIGGPKGIAALYLKHSTPFLPLMRGGGQEAGKRSGTQNVCGAAAFAAAAQLAQDKIDQEPLRLRELRDYLYELCRDIEKVNPTFCVEPASQDYLPHIVSLLVDGFESETLILRLDLKGFAVSGGSACSSHSLDPSHVLTAVGLSRDLAQGSLRVSLGSTTQKNDIDAFVVALKECIA